MLKPSGENPPYALDDGKIEEAFNKVATQTEHMCHKMHRKVKVMGIDEGKFGKIVAGWGLTPATPAELHIMLDDGVIELYELKSFVHQRQPSYLAPTETPAATPR